ncbi:MAG TPA: EutN/CcmL family microcompartment protein [Pirellulales bacterium]|jgi:ethanolamine utilization protein EutN|nr:EutN/CcmL family microcompartment protein [Pirellulales bacterium]
MRIGKVIGTVTLNRSHPSLLGATYKLAAPMTLDELAKDLEPAAEALVVYDELGAGLGSLIAISEGGEAAQPFYPDQKPVDAYNAAILDKVEVKRTYDS